MNERSQTGITKGVATMKRLAVSLAVFGLVAGSIALAAAAGTAKPAKGQAAHQTMIIVGHTLGQKGPDGRTHDTTYGADFSVERGQSITVTVYNFDEGPHTITSPALKLNVQIPGAKDEDAGIPSKTTFTFTATKAGVYRWFCTLPCDKKQSYWAMSASKKGSGQDGFMAGYITVTA
jgi:plastocyanin